MPEHQCVAVPCGQLPRTMAGSAGSGFSRGVWALRTSVSTCVGARTATPFVAWPQRSGAVFYTAFQWLHRGYQPQLQRGEEHGP